MTMYPTTNISCLYLTDPDLVYRMAESVTLAPDMSNMTAFESCQVNMPPKLPTKPFVWLLNIIVALLGISQMLFYVCK